MVLNLSTLLEITISPSIFLKVSTKIYKQNATLEYAEVAQFLSHLSLYIFPLPSKRS